MRWGLGDKKLRHAKLLCALLPAACPGVSRAMHGSSWGWLEWPSWNSQSPSRGACCLLLVECRDRDAIACLTAFREISSNRESQCVVPVAIEERHWRVKNDKDIIAATAPVRLKEALRERQFPRINLGSYAGAVALDA
jgi:hypothetical protein